MRRFLIAIAAGTLASGAAVAADLPTKAPRMAPPIPAIPFTWSGCYIGIDGGYAWGRDHDHEVTTATGVTSAFTPLSSAKITGGKLGGYLGCNMSTGGPWILGLEADAEWANVKGSTTFNTPAPQDFYEARIRAEGSVRARVGYAFDRVLFYITGGAAFADVREHDQVGATGAFTNNSSTRAGWTAGAGFDYAFTTNWIGRVEYRYADFGTFRYQPTVFPAFTENHKITENVVRVGLAYKF